MMQRVAAYCRVSTDSNDQANSLASQERYFKEYIDRNPEWNLAEVYVDTGKTGTSTKKRAAFNQMIADAMSQKIDLIITKEISRFARNTLDSIYYTRKLKEQGVGVIFMNDNINTLDADAELRLTIMSSIAQEESRKTSERVKWGQKRRMEQGVVFGRDMLGYDVKDGKLTVNPEGAETVRLIFHKFVNEGKGTHVIAREFREVGIKTATYMKQWSNTVILRILRNEKMCGDLIQKKTYTPSYLNHEKKYNCGQEEFVVLRDHHEPIISRKLFEKAQRELERRSPTPEQKSKHSNRYCFSGKIKCGICGSSFVSRTKKRKDGSIHKSWRCYQGATHGAKHIDSIGEEVGCSSPSVNDEDLKHIVQQVIGSLMMDKMSIIKSLNSVVSSVLNEAKPQGEAENTDQKINILTQKKQGLIELYLSKDISKTEFQSLKEKYEAEIGELQKSQEQQTKHAQLCENKQSILEKVSQLISGMVTGELWDDTFYRNLLDTITVSEDHSLTVTLNLIQGKWNAALQAIPQCHFAPSLGSEVSKWRLVFSDIMDRRVCMGCYWRIKFIS